LTFVLGYSRRAHRSEARVSQRGVAATKVVIEVFQETSNTSILKGCS